MSETFDGSRSPSGRPAGGRKWWALAACCFGLFMALLDVTVINVALPVIQRDLGASFSALQWVIDAYTIALAVLLVTAGRLGDIFGRKRVFMVGLGIFTVGSLLCGLSADFTVFGLSHIQVLWGARVIQGVGGSVMLPVSLAIVSSTFEGRQRGMAIGIWGGVSGLATAIGPVVGGILVEKVSWQSIFYLNLPVGVIGVALSAWAIRESRDELASRSIDLFGLATITAGLFCLVLALIEGGDRGWGSAYILTLLAISAGSLILFVVGELRIRNPMVDPRLFKNKSFTGSAITAFVLSAGLYSMFFFLALYLQNSLSFNAFETGLRLLPLSGLVLFAAPLAGNLTGRIGPRPVLFAGMALLAVARAAGKGTAAKPPVLVSASSTGYYGFEGWSDEEVDEDHPPVDDAWHRGVALMEAESLRAEAFGTRVALLRIGVVLKDGEGTLAYKVPQFRSGWGGPTPPGDQWCPWVHIDDVIGLSLMALENEQASGPINADAPGVVLEREYAETLGHLLGQPADNEVPETVIRQHMGLSAEIVMHLRRVVPRKALALGYRFEYPDLESALRELVS